MAQRIFITATNTDIGKTFATKLLLNTFSSMGYRVAAFKPIETGVSDRPPDGTELLTLAQHLNPELEKLNIHDIVPLQFRLPAAPYVANNASPMDFGVLDAALKKIEPLCDILLIEGAGGLMVPLDPTTMIIDLIRRFQAKTLLISHCRLGCINDTLLNLGALQQANLPFRWALNCRSSDIDFQEVSKPYFTNHYPEYYELSRDIEKLALSLLKL